jgi:hypothetical protein
MVTQDRLWRVLLLAALMVTGLVVLSVLFAVMGWWQLIFR